MLQRNGQSGKQLTFKRHFLLQLILLDEATLVLVNDGEGFLEVIGGLASQADLCEEALVVERVSSCVETEYYLLLCFIITVYHKITNIYFELFWSIHK